MNQKITLTTKEKIMNMAEPGTVSAAGNYFSTLGNPHKQRAGGLMRYTLCVFQDKARRHGSRYGFAFDIAAISGRSPGSSGCTLSERKFPRSASGRKLINSFSGVTRSRLWTNCHIETPLQNLAKPYGLRRASVLPPEKILFHLCNSSATPLQTRAGIGLQPDLSARRKVKLFHVCQIRGGCHE